MSELEQSGEALECKSLSSSPCNGHGASATAWTPTSIPFAITDIISVCVCPSPVRRVDYGELDDCVHMAAAAASRKWRLWTNLPYINEDVDEY